MTKKIFFILFISAFSLNFVKNVFADPPPWAPAHGYREKHRHHRGYDEERDYDHDEHEHHHKVKKVYKYVYYPEQEVYYYPVARRYYYRKPSGGWSFGLTLPGNISIGASSGREVELDTDRPYLHHSEIQLKFR